MKEKMNIDVLPPSREFKRRVSYLYHPNIGDFHYGEKHYMKPARVKITHSLVTAYGLQDHMQIFTPRPASFREMAKFHSDDYLDFLRRVTPEDTEEIIKYQARYNVGEYCPDCPVFEGVYEFCSISTGGSIVAAKRINQGVADIAINWGGGLHHAKKSEASGFCYVNDIVLAIVELLKYHQRVLYIDTDVHHGDGVEEAFYSTDRVMSLSLHKFGEFFPGTGALTDIGIGKGKHYSVNVPLNDGIDDESYKYIFNSIVEHIMNWYRPGVVVLQLGADSLVGDRLGAFNLSMRGHAHSVSFLKKFNVPFVMVGGGGYTIRNVSRAWCYETSVAVGVDLPEDLPYHEYFEYYHPNYLLDVTASNMENLNSREYLDAIKMVVIENLRHVAHAPSVEHHPIPVDYWSSSEDEDDVINRFHDNDDMCNMRCSNNSSYDSSETDYSFLKSSRKSLKNDYLENRAMFHHHPNDDYCNPSHHHHPPNSPQRKKKQSNSFNDHDNTYELSDVNHCHCHSVDHCCRMNDSANHHHHDNDTVDCHHYIAENTVDCHYHVLDDSSNHHHHIEDNSEHHSHLDDAIHYHVNDDDNIQFDAPNDNKPLPLPLNSPHHSHDCQKQKHSHYNENYQVDNPPVTKPSNFSTAPPPHYHYPSTPLNCCHSSSTLEPLSLPPDTTTFSPPPSASSSLHLNEKTQHDHLLENEHYQNTDIPVTQSDFSTYPPSSFSHHDNRTSEFDNNASSNEILPPSSVSHPTSYNPTQLPSSQTETVDPDNHE